MRIGLNLLYLLPGIVGGTETYAAGLLSGLAQIDQRDEFIVFVSREAAHWPIPGAPNFSRVVCPVSATSRTGRYLFEQLRLPALLKAHELDIVHSLGYVTPVLATCRSVVSILDIVYDYPGALSFAKKQMLKLLVAASAHRAAHIITISEASQRQLVSRLHVSPDKITVTWLAPKARGPVDGRSWGALASRLGVSGKYVLAFSSISPSKNIPTLLQAFAQLSTGLADDVQLVLVGHEPQRGTSLREQTDLLGLQGRVIFTGYLSDSDLTLVLNHASVFAFPSLYEGFGIPVLEAMAAGVPVACSAVASLPEVAADAALLFDPRSPGGIADALRQLLTNADLHQELVAKGYRNLTRFSWKSTAEKTLDVYRRLTRA